MHRMDRLPVVFYCNIYIICITSYTSYNTEILSVCLSVHPSVSAGGGWHADLWASMDTTSLYYNTEILSVRPSVCVTMTLTWHAVNV